MEQPHILGWNQDSMCGECIACSKATSKSHGQISRRFKLYINVNVSRRRRERSTLMTPLRNALNTQATLLSSYGSPPFNNRWNSSGTTLVERSKEFNAIDAPLSPSWKNSGCDVHMYLRCSRSMNRTHRSTSMRSRS
jgi:hypothetical protein